MRNTEDAEKAVVGGSGVDATLGRKTAVWGMIEESELAKTIRGSFDKVLSQVNNPGIANTAPQQPSSTAEGDALVAQIRQVISDLEDHALHPPSGSSERQTPSDVDSEVTRRANELQPKLQLLVEKSLGEEIPKVDELLALNDSLTSMLASTQGALAPGILPITRRASQDQGTRLTVDIPLYNGSLSPDSTGTPNGHIHESPSTTDDSDEEVSTPRLDKGKQRAAEEPERPTPVLRRPSLVLDSEDEFAEPEVHPEAGISPTVDRSAIGTFFVVLLQLDVDLNTLTGLVVGSKKRERSSVRGLSSSALRRWRESMRAKSCERRLVSCASQRKLRSNLLTVSIPAP